MKKNILLTITTIAILLFSNKSFSQTLELGILSSFETFTGVGAVTNGGTSAGDAGTNDGSISGPGFDSSNGYCCTTYNADSTTIQARIDLLRVYMHLDDIFVTQPSTHAPAFGSGETIAPGVYSIGGAGSVSGALTLDGGGDTDAVFIIKFEGALTVGAASTITLSNGTRAANVFWIAQGAITLEASSVMKGTVFAHPGAVTLGAGSTIEGRLYSSEGAISIAAAAEAEMPVGPITIPINCVGDCTAAPAVDVLGSIKKFGLFTSFGAVANAATSAFVGDIGTDGGGTISGFGTSTRVGSFYIADAITDQARIDLDFAYTALMAIPNTVTGHTPAFGSGEILNAGVYSIAAAGSLAGTVTLDGLGDPDAIFIFKFAGAFSVAAQSRVILTNGTRRCNVFWISEGAASMGTFTYMKGTVLAHNGACSAGANTSVEGRMLSTGGAIGFSTGVLYNDALCFGDDTPITSGDQTVCSDGTNTQTLTASATSNTTGGNIIWYDDATAGSVVDPPSQVGVGTVTYYAESFNDTYASTTRTAATLTIEANNTVTITGDNQICFSDNPTLTASETGGSWSSSNPGVATIDLNGVVTPEGQGTATIIYDLTTNGCYDGGTFMITINNDLSVSLNGNSTICGGENTYVNASVSGTWSSSDVSIVTISTTGEITGIGSGNASISFTSTDGCTAVLSTPITAVANPVVSLLGPAEICINSTTSLSPTSGGLWVSSNNSIASINNSGVVTGNSVGNATFNFYESTNGCVSDVSITIVVNESPTINALSDDDLCIGQFSSITPDSGGTWTSTNDSAATIDTNGIIAAVGAGSARFIFTSDTTGCSSEQSDALTVNAKAATNFTGPTTICLGDQSSISPPSGGQWTSTNAAVATITQNGTITAGNPGTVSFIYTNNLTGCSSDPSIPLTVGEPTETILTGPSTICVNETTSMLPNSGGTWSSSNISIATISNNGEIVGHNAGVATFTFDSNTECISKPSTAITIVSNPVVGFSGPSNICIETTTNLSPNTGGIWTSSNTSVATVDNTGLVTAIGFGSAQFTFEKTSTGCESTIGALLNVYTKPVPEIIGDDEICIGFATYLTPSSGGTWTSSNTAVAVISSNGQATGVASGTASFTFYESGSNCVTDASALVTVLPKTQVFIDGDNSICVGETTSVSPKTGGSWVSDNTNVATVTNAGTVTAISSGIVKFTFVSNAGCESNKTSPVIVNGPPSVSINGPNQICIDEQVQLLPSSGGTWISSNITIATIDNNGLATAIIPGEVNFTFTDSNTGCVSDPSGNIIVSETPTTGLNGPSDICIGNITFLTPSTGGYWTTLAPEIASIQNNGQVTGVGSGEAIFVFTHVNTGCDSEVNNNITVLSSPLINFTGPTSICEDGMTNITSSNPGIWESLSPLIATITNEGLITGVSAGSAKFRFTESSTGCLSNLSENLIVNGPPTVAGSGYVCIGSTTSLFPSTDGTWESLAPAIATVTANGVVTGETEGSAFFIFTDSQTGCISDGNLSVEVAPEIGAQITGDSEICIGYTTTLYPDSGGIWTSNNTAVATVSNFGIVKGIAPGIVMFTFEDSSNGCSAGGTTDPVTVGKCLNHDLNIALVDQDIVGDISTNDNFTGAVTYSNIKVTLEKPLESLPQLVINTDGTYSFLTNIPGKYLFKVSACIPPLNVGCPGALLEINVIDNVYGQSNPVSNLDFAATYANSDVTQPGNIITVYPLSNDGCVYTAGCNIDNGTMSIIDSSQNGSAVLSGTGSLSYTPDPGFIGHDTILYQVCVSGSNCSQSRQIITVNAPNALNSIFASDDFAYTLKGISKGGNVTDNDIDPENDSLTVTQQGSITSPILIPEGSYYINIDGSYEFMPDGAFSGALKIVYTVCDDNVSVACTDATLHILVFDDLTLGVRVYLEGSLMQNENKLSIKGHPLMRDGLRVCANTGENFIPIKDPYTYVNELFDDIPSKFDKVGPGLLAENLEITDSIGVFSVLGDNAIVDWLHVELRDKNDSTVTIATRSGLLQRDGDIVDLDGTSLLRFQTIYIDSFYIVVRHRTHLGVMSEKVKNGTVVDFTSPSTPTFNFGTSLSNGMDYTGLSQKSTVKSGYLAMWAGDFNSDGQLKYSAPASDINILYGNVLFSSPAYLINYDFTIEYFRGDFNMDGKAKYSNPNDDRNLLQAQIIFYPLNTNFISNLDGLIQQVP